MSALPSVTAVVPTRNRPALLARAVRAILDQQYDGDLDILIVVDQRRPASAPRPGWTTIRGSRS